MGRRITCFEMGYYTSSLVPPTIYIVIVGLALAIGMVLLGVIWGLRGFGWRKTSFGVSVILSTILVGFAGYIEFECGAAMSVPGYFAGDTWVDNDGAVRSLALFSWLYLPFLVLGILGIVGGFLLPVRSKASTIAAKD